MDGNEFKRLKSYEEAIDLLKSTPEDTDYFDAVDRMRAMAHPVDPEQYSEIMALLVSVPHQIEWEKMKQRAMDKIDILRDAYDGKTPEDYEKLRLDTIRGVLKENLLDSIDLISRIGEEICSAVDSIVEKQNIRKVIKAAYNLDVLNRMLKDGVSLSKVVKYLEVDVLDAYKAAEKLGMPFQLSEEEEKMVKEAGEEEQKKRRFPFGRRK